MIKIKRIFLLCSLFCYCGAFSQETDNPFSTSEKEIYTDSQQDENRFAPANDENEYDVQNFGPPGDDDGESVPIDQYLPVLVVLAVVAIGYIGTKKQTIGTG